MTLRVLQVVPSFAGGGAERQLVRLAGGLVSSGIEVHIAHLHDGPNSGAASRSGATLHRLASWGNHDPRVVMAICRLIRGIRPAVVQTWLLHADVFGGSAARWCHIPWILTERSSATMYERGLKFALRRRVGLHADEIIANSQGGAEYWRGAGYRGPTTVIRNILQTSGCRKGPAIGLDDDRAPTILAIGRLSEEKNWPLLLDALETVLSRMPQCQAAILGDGPLRAALEARVVSSAVLSARVTLPGHVFDIEERLRRASLLVSLSRFEGSPNAVLEAIAHECPLVLSDIPAHRELLSPDEARFVQLASPVEISAAIIESLSDPEGARQRARRAQARACAWSMEPAVAAYVEVYDRVSLGRSSCAS